jgi:hypothetical protein
MPKARMFLTIVLALRKAQNTWTEENENNMPVSVVCCVCEYETC